MKPLKIGSHVGMSGKEMLLGSVKEAVSYGANTFMFYTGAPQNTRRKELSELNIEPAWEYMKEHGIDEIVVHAPYIINLGNSVKPETFELAVEFLNKEIQRTVACKSHTLILHPGAHVGAGAEAGTKQIIKGLNEVLTAGTDCCIALETMAGKGSEIGRTFEELARISDINDSKNPRGAAKDRHANIGFGEIGFDALHYIVTHKDFENVPKILETPYIPDPENKKKSYAPYKYEIEMLRSGTFCPDLPEQILRAFS